MNQLETLNDYPLLHSVSSKREQLDLSSLDIDLLKAQAGSQDLQLASISQKILRTKWDLDPGQDALEAKSIDIKEQLNSFSRNELNVMFRNLVSIQLTEGCNGNCPFCLFGTKTGVTAKYSFDSLRSLFNENSKLMNENPFLLYWDSDPFDYRDGDKSFVDVYQLYRQTMPNNSQYISTAIPRGGENDFVNFMLYHNSELASEDRPNKRIVPVRISLTQQNIQRVEATLLELTNKLLERGLTVLDINTFYSKVLYTIGRFDNFLLPIGPYIKKADDIKNTFSTACRDGVVISPRSCQAIMMTAATIYEPSGQTNIELLPGQAEALVPVKIREEHHAKFTFGEKSLTLRTALKQTMLPVIRHTNGEQYSLSNKSDDAILKLGREVSSLSRLISNFSRVADLNITSTDAINNKNAFMTVSTEVFRERQNHTQSLIVSMEQLCDNALLSDEERKQIQYYILLTQVHLAKMDFLADQVEQGQSVIIVSKMASILEEVGRDDIDKLPAILEALSEQNTNESIFLNLLDKTVIRSFINDIH